MAIWEIDEDEETIEGLDAQGRPDPAYAAALGLVPAPLGRRAVAALIDFAVYALLQIPYLVFTLPLLLRLLTGRIGTYGFVNHPRFTLAMLMAGATTLLTLIFCIAQLALHGRKGTTLGKSLTGIRSVNVSTLQQPGIWRVFLRSLVVWASGVVLVGPILFLLSPTFDRQKRGRGWHDEIGQTWLVDVRNGLQPYDAKRMRIARKTLAAEPVEGPKALPSLATALGTDDHPEYRPGARISAGVLGVARPTTQGAAPPAPPAQAPAPPARPTPPPAPAAPAPAPALASFYLVLDTGERVEVNGAVVLGRDPAGVGGGRRVPIVDDSASVSKTHLTLRPVDGGVEVVDQHSTNGTAITHDAVERLLEPGVPAIAQAGDTIGFGDRTAVVARG